MKTAKKAYDEILQLLEKHKDIHIYDLKEMEAKAKHHLFGIELKEKYGLDIDPKKIHSLEWNKFGDFIVIGIFGENKRRTISWSDDGKQPEDELLLYISFPTGAFIFGDDYPKELFQKFWLELKSYKPKYCDTTNNGLYFSMETSSDIFNNFRTILNKYHEINVKDSKIRQIKKLEESLEQLKERRKITPSPKSL